MAEDTETLIHHSRKRLQCLGSLEGAEGSALAGKDAEDLLPSPQPSPGLGAETWPRPLEMMETGSPFPQAEEEARRRRASPSLRGTPPPPLELDIVPWNPWRTKPLWRLPGLSRQRVKLGAWQQLLSGRLRFPPGRLL